MIGEQLSMSVASLPDRFVDAFRAAEAARNVRQVTLEALETLHHPVTGWWLEVLAGGRRWAICGRADLDAAGRDLCVLVHGGG